MSIYTYFSINTTVLPLLVVPVNSFTINLPFPLIVIISFNFICLESLVSFCPLTKTLSCSMMLAALLLEVLAKSETILSNLKEGTIILTSSTFTSFFLKFSSSAIVMLLFSNLVKDGNSCFI